MSRVTRPALRGTVLGRVLRFLNPVVRRLLASRIHWPLSRWLALLRWTGPTGRRRTLPVSYIREASAVYLTSGDRWSSDFAGGAPVAMRVRGRWYRHAEAATADDGEARIILRRLFEDHPWFRMLSGIPGSRSGGASPRALDMALGAGRVLIRVSLGAGHPGRPPRVRAAGGL